MHSISHYHHHLDKNSFKEPRRRRSHKREGLSLSAFLNTLKPSTTSRFTNMGRDFAIYKSSSHISKLLGSDFLKTPSSPSSYSHSYKWYVLVQWSFVCRSKHTTTPISWAVTICQLQRHHPQAFFPPTWPFLLIEKKLCTTTILQHKTWKRWSCSSRAWQICLYHSSSPAPQ